MHPEQVKLIAERLDVRKRDVLEMNRRLCGDLSLNVHLREDEHAPEWQDLLLDERPDQEMLVAENDEFEWRCRDLRVALTTLGDRERYVFEMRRLADEPVPLQLWHRNLASRANGCARSSTERLKRSAGR
jgi:RNA polymerase sigma-32 factor